MKERKFIYRVVALTKQWHVIEVCVTSSRKEAYKVLSRAKGNPELFDPKVIINHVHQ